LLNLISTHPLCRQNRLHKFEKAFFINEDCVRAPEFSAYAIPLADSGKQLALVGSGYKGLLGLSSLRMKFAIADNELAKILEGLFGLV
jgi:precorrin-3B methylase